jgi:hypothetical protein
MSRILSLKEAMGRREEAQTMSDKEGCDVTVPPLSPREQYLIRLGIGVTRTKDEGSNFATTSPNMPNIMATGPTAAESLQNFYDSAPTAEGNTRRRPRGPRTHSGS